jgi:heme exporter protein D
MILHYALFACIGMCIGLICLLVLNTHQLMKSVIIYGLFVFLSVVSGILGMICLITIFYMFFFKM